jgi:hypothetical protein
MGRMIVRQWVDGSSGKAVVERLAADFQATFPGDSGFSASNLWPMEDFYEVYASSEKLTPLVRQIAWSHNWQASGNRLRTMRVSPSERFIGTPLFLAIG